MTTKLEKTIGVSIALIALGICIILGIMKYERHKAFNTEGFIGKSEIEITDGQMTPEVLLAFGRLSDPQVSPDGKSLMYGVSYTSIEDNRSCRNIYISNLDGSEATLATRSGKSISNARWSKDGSRVAFLTGGQIWGGKVGRDRRIKAVRRLSNVPGGISEFSFSPDGKKVLYISMTQGRVLKPVQEYADLPDARAYKTDRLMYRHWDHWTTE
ncbi:MAG: peptidase S9, partial [Candidatus Cryptobacteroides sp.]|nr:peptidase S9 [Candidatus Cryptobacteroides sp.]